MNRTFHKAPPTHQTGVDIIDGRTASRNKATRTQSSFNKINTNEKYYNELRAISALDDMLKSGQMHSKNNVDNFMTSAPSSAAPNIVKTSGPALSNTSNWNSVNMKKDFGKAQRQAKILRKGTSFFPHAP